MRSNTGRPSAIIVFRTFWPTLISVIYLGAGERGYRFACTQGGETVFGGNEVVIIMKLDPEGRRFRYILLATNRTGTMEREMNEAPPEYEFVGMTVFSATFGGNEAAVILEAEIDDTPPR